MTNFEERMWKSFGRRRAWRLAILGAVSGITLGIFARTSWYGDLICFVVVSLCLVLLIRFNRAVGDLKSMDHQYHEWIEDVIRLRRKIEKDEQGV